MIQERKLIKHIDKQLTSNAVVPGSIPGLAINCLLSYLHLVLVITPGLAGESISRGKRIWVFVCH